MLKFCFIYDMIKTMHFHLDHFSGLNAIDVTHEARIAALAHGKNKLLL